MNAVIKRPGYSVMHETPAADKGRELAKMVKTNPRALDYFRSKNLFVRAGEIGKMVIFTETHSRKEALRSSLYDIAEPHLKDGKMRDINIEAQVKIRLNEAKADIMSKPVRTAEEVATVAVIDELLKKENEIDSPKILRDKELWWRRILRMLALGAAAALLLWKVAPTPVEKPPQIVEKKIEDPAVRKSLEECLAALNNVKCSKGKVVFKEGKEKTVYKDKKIDLDDACASRVGPLASEVLALQDELAKWKALPRDGEKYKKFKLDLMSKVDAIFGSVGTEKENDIYQATIRPWFKKGLDADDDAMILMVVHMGGEFLGQTLEKNTVTKVGRIKTPSEFTDLLEDGNVTYTYGSAGGFNKWNRKAGLKQSVFQYYKGLYDEFKKSIGNGK